jgi:hypothetical protein
VHVAQYSAFVLFGAYTGQRSEATIAKLTVGQFRKTLAVDKPVLQVDSLQDKIRMSHRVQLHPRVLEALKPLLVGRDDDERVENVPNEVHRSKISVHHAKDFLANLRTTRSTFYILKYVVNYMGIGHSFEQ